VKTLMAGRKGNGGSEDHQQEQIHLPIEIGIAMSSQAGKTFAKIGQKKKKEWNWGRPPKQAPRGGGGPKK